MKKKTLWIILAAAVVAAGAVTAVLLSGGRQQTPGHGNVDDIDWYDPQGTEFVITDADMLYDLATLSYHYDFAGQTVKLGADITVNSGDAADWEKKAPAISWRPIQQFAGTFDGQGHTVSGLYAKTINTPTAMFLNVKSSAVIRDFRLENTLFLTAGRVGSAAIAANFAGTFQRIYTNATVRCTYGQVGGILCEQIGNATAEECWFDGELESTYKTIGGIADRAYGAELVIRHCLNTGKIIDEYKRVANNAGGLVGMTEGGARLVVEDCFSDGELVLGNLNRSGSVMGGGDGTSSVTFIDTFAVYERFNVTVSPLISNKVGGPVPIPEKHAAGFEAYQWMGLDFENYWACREGSGPVLQYFADRSMDLTGIEKKVDYDWYDDTASELVVRDLPDLYAFMLLAYSTEYEGKTVKLDADFSLNEGRAEDWIENAPEEYWIPLPWFAGTLDGQGHTLSGVYIVGESVLGLCAHTRAMATVKNLRLVNSLIHAKGDKDNMSLSGAISGRGGGTFDTIYTDAIVYACGQESGGLIGQTNLNNVFITMTNCWFDGKVWAVGEKDGYFVGGLVGGHVLGTMNMTHCLFSGTIHTEVDKGSRAGGFVGWVMNDAVLNVGDCLNTGVMDTLNHNWVGAGIGNQGKGPTVAINKSYAMRECMDGPSGDYVSHILTSDEADITGAVVPVYRQNLIGLNACRWTDLNFEKFWSVRANGTPVPTAFYEGEAISTEGVSPIFSYEWYDAENGGGTIYSAADFIGFTMLSWATDFKGETVRLGANVTLNSGNAADWAASAPYMRIVPMAYFSGTFDGQGHTISGVYQRDQVMLGLFSRTDKESVIRNFWLVNSFYDVTGFGKFRVGYSGSVVGYFGGVLQNVYSSAIIRANGIMCGGIVGRSNQPETNLISGVWFDGVLNAPDEEYGYYVGGIMGTAHAGTNRLEHCLFTGTIRTAVSNKGSKVGGMIGTVENAGTSAAIVDCLSAGTLQCGNPYYLGALIGTTYTGNTITVSGTFADETVAIGGNGQFVSVATHADVKAGEVKGVAVPLSAEKLEGLNGYRWTTLDFDKYWAAREGACPGLKYFVSSPLNTGATERMVDISWYNASAKKMTIDSAADLNGWQILAYGDDFAGKTVLLGADITVNSGNASDWITAAPENVWTPVTAFAGTFDGQGHTISGLYADSGSLGGSGLIGTLQGTVKNLRLTNSCVTGSGGDVGSVAGRIRNGGTLESVYSDAFVVADNDYNIGGLLGAVRNVGGDETPARVINCWFAGAVESGEGYNVGGLVGCPVNDQSLLVIDNCLMSGSVHTDAQRRAGGVICHTWNESHARISNTLVTGTVTTGGGGQTGSVLGYATQNTELQNVYALASSSVAGIGLGSAAGKVQVMENSLLSGTVAYQFTALDFTSRPYWAAVADSTPVLASHYSGTPLDLTGVVRPDSSWFDETVDTLTVRTVEDMIAFAVVGKQSDFAGKTVVLDADIDMNPGWTVGSDAPEVEWPAMTQAFKGTFDGQGHTIRGLYVNRDSGEIGLFGRMESGSAVRDLTLANSSFTGTGVYVAALSGVINGGTVENVTVASDVAVKGAQSVGGIGGMVNTVADIRNCKVSAALTATSGPARVGGILGYVTGVGVTSVSGCTFIGSIDQGTALIAGGIVGQVGSQTVLQVSDCVAVPSSVTAGGMVSLIVGHFGTSGNTVTDCAGVATGNASYLVDSGAAGNVTVSSTFTDTSFEGRVLEIADSYDLIHAAALTKRLYQNGGALITRGAEFKGATLRLAADVDLSDVASFPMFANDVVSGAAVFRGTFDGNGHTIRNMTITSGGQYVAMFRVCDNAVIKDLTLENPCVTAIGNYYDLRVGILMGYAFTGSGTVSGVTITGGTMNAPSGGRVGGMIGCSMGALTVEDCCVDVTVTAEKYGEGFTTAGSYGVGGLLGSAANAGLGVIRNTTVTGTINGCQNVGGLVGDWDRGAASYLTIDNCTCSATVNGLSRFTGGIAGVAAYPHISHTTFTGTVNNSYTGINNCVGGLLGATDRGGEITDCSVSGDVLVTAGGPSRAGGILGTAADGGTLTISRCEFSGSLSAVGNMAGGIVGNVWQGGYKDGANGAPTVNVTDCVVLGDVICSGMSGNVVGYVNSGSAHVTGCMALRARLANGDAFNQIIADNGNRAACTVSNCAVTINLARNDSDIGPQAYTVTTAYQLMELAKLSKVSNLRRWTITLGADIVLNDTDVNAAVASGDTDGLTVFPMIGRKGALGVHTLYFRGVFDGQNHTVSGVYVPDSDEMGVGFFAWIDSAECTVKDFTLTNSYIHSGGAEDGISRAGAIAGDSHAEGGATISGVTVGADVTVSAAGEQAGGILGGAFGGVTISDCHFNGTVDADARHAGGILGYHTGGSPVISNCTMGGTVLGTEDVGGIESPATVGGSSVVNCSVTGTVSTKPTAMPQ